jgi:hypothetical protein
MSGMTALAAVSQCNNLFAAKSTHYEASKSATPEDKEAMNVCCSEIKHGRWWGEGLNNSGPNPYYLTANRIVGGNVENRFTKAFNEEGEAMYGSLHLVA